MSLQNDPKHNQTRGFLRVLGPAIAVLGLIFVVIGLVSFFSSFGSFQPPRYFWCAFIGMPLLAVGVGISKFAYLGAVSRYMADEVTPVGKDVVNYMAHGTKDAIGEVASAIGQGLGLKASTSPTQLVRCHKCNADNEVDAKFCKQCGSPLTKSKPCPNCDELNDPDARFCDNCGKPLS